LTFELSLNWPNFDFDYSAVGVAFDFLQLRSWQARCNALDVSENAPCVIYGNCNSELMI
jgi:hypothetical protein